MALVENLRRYVGEQVPPEAHSQMWESERQDLVETVQVRVWGQDGTGVGWDGGPQGLEGCPREKGHREATVRPVPPAALAGGPGQPAGDSGAAAGACAKPHPHLVHAGGRAGQEGRSLTGRLPVGWGAV